MPPHFMFAPLERHIDSGFGATGEEFMRSAEALSNAPQQTPQSRVPVAFLYRHACELFLKGSILTVHRSLKIPFGSVPFDGDAQIKVGQKWRSIYQVHSVGDLFAHLKAVLVENREALHRRATTHWDEIPESLAAEVAAVQELDSTSTFFRYPTSKQGGGGIKSTFQSTPNLDAVASGPPAITLLVLDNDETVKEAFTSQRSSMDAPIALLAAAAASLYAAQIGLRMQLADGW